MSEQPSKGKSSDGDLKKSHFRIHDSLPVSPIYFRNTASHVDPKVLVWKNHPRSADDELPYPPTELMQYQEPEEIHRNAGKRLADMIRQFLIDNGIEPTSISKALEFGCSNARVLRHFQDLASVEGTPILNGTVGHNLGSHRRVRKHDGRTPNGFVAQELDRVI